MATPHVIAQPDLSVPPPLTVTVEEYLRSSYDPDRDYIDGELEERNLGEWEHGDLQSELVAIFRANRKLWGYRAAVEVRLQISPRRFRVPDVMVLRKGQRAARVIREAPLVCIEVLSPEDQWRRMERRLADYLHLGVQHVWVLDPQSREAFRVEASGRHHVENGLLSVPGTSIHLNVLEIFATLQQDALAQNSPEIEQAKGPALARPSKASEEY